MLGIETQPQETFPCFQASMQIGVCKHSKSKFWILVLEILETSTSTILIF